MIGLAVAGAFGAMGDMMETGSNGMNLFNQMLAIAAEFDIEISRAQTKPENSNILRAIQASTAAISGALT